ncbi:CinA family protein [Chryseobacterium gambrini]|uniref:CinA family protein n=1 Tax=Chryseobacterium gambrini TaxID=373672 RepID=UPI0022F3F8F0|nr:nicotinamide-nucleotide amidohydrolase family protein [Chryseobacterium gambrini]WBX97830.1 nicotinamide-nucleotide amidohydrolase family protein [Chryseobacterium gambrini]
MEIKQSLLDYIGEALKTVQESVSVAESVTAGYLQFSFSQMKDASTFFKGGITAYTLEEKVKLLKVNKEEAESCDCVSKQIAEEMAVHVADLFNTDWGISVTGYARPVEESDQKIFAYFSFAYKSEVILSKKLELSPKTNAMTAQKYYSEFILGCFKCELNQMIILK